MIAAVILAGGEARRLGGADKSLLVLEGASLLERVIERLRGQASAVALSANGDPARFSRFGLPVLGDLELGQGPLGGILRGLQWAEALGASALLSVPVDTPFLPLDLAERLSPAPSVASGRGRLHHAVALWPVKCGRALETHLRQGGSRAVRGFASLIQMRPVAFDDQASDPFFNINTADDLRHAQLLLSPSWRDRTADRSV